MGKIRIWQPCVKKKHRLNEKSETAILPLFGRRRSNSDSYSTDFWTKWLGLVHYKTQAMIMTKESVANYYVRGVLHSCDLYIFIRLIQKGTANVSSTVSAFMTTGISLVQNGVKGIFSFHPALGVGDVQRCISLPGARPPGFRVVTVATAEHSIRQHPSIICASLCLSQHRYMCYSPMLFCSNTGVLLRNMSAGPRLWLYDTQQQSSVCMETGQLENKLLENCQKWQNQDILNTLRH